MSEFTRNFGRVDMESLLDCAGKQNIADKITEMLLNKELFPHDVPAVCYKVLVENWNYAVISVNLKSSIADADAFFNEISKWKAADIVMVYHHPDLDAICINPKNPAHKEYIADLRKNELVVVYIGYEGKKDPDAVCKTMLEKCSDLLLGKKVKAPDSFAKGSYTFKKAKTASSAKPKATKPAKSAAAKPAKTTAEKPAKATSVASSGGKFSFGTSTESDVVVKKPTTEVKPSSLRKMSPMISVPVTNELFHNGNVEAWKKIIASYQYKYPNLQIFVYYDGERITDINALFKWGKVKHGSCIQFVVAGDDIQDVAKLKRYFTQGASPMFEAFLKGAPGSILKLF